MKQYRMPSPYLGLRSGCQGHQGRCWCFEPWATVLTGRQLQALQQTDVDRAWSYWRNNPHRWGVHRVCILDFTDLSALLNPSAAANAELSKSTETLSWEHALYFINIKRRDWGENTGRSTEHKQTHTCCLLWLTSLWLMYNMVLWLLRANKTLVKHLNNAMQTCKARLDFQ